MLTDIPAEQCAAVIDACASQLLKEASLAAPPVDALLLAERLELLVARDSATNVRARFVRLNEAGGGLGAILLADESRAERRQWAVAHEVGEWAAHRVFAMLGASLADIPASARERVANGLACALLLPQDWFDADGTALGWDLLDLKRLYHTASHELIARRMIEMRPSVIITIFDQGRLQWRRSNVLRSPPPLTSAEEKTWQSSYDFGKPSQYCGQDLPQGINDIRCWPVHEDDWRREILRTELESW